jgi:two-component system, NarL family, response regulator DegU
MDNEREIIICVADDHQFVRDAMVSLIKSFSRVKEVYAVADGLAVIDSLKNKMPDIIIMDVRTPNMNGIQTTRKILENYPTIKILTLNISDDKSDIIKLVKSGVKGYIPKRVGSRDCEKAIYQVFDGGEFFDERVTQALVESVRNENIGRAGASEKVTSLLQLTNREKEILKLICQDLPNREIIKRLDISAKTLQAHKQNMIKKTGANSIISLVTLASTSGIFASEVQ